MGRPSLPRRCLLRPAAFKETAEALFVLAFAIFLTAPGALPRAGGPAAVRAAGAGHPRRHLLLLQLRRPRLAAAILALWSLTLPAVRTALRPRSLLRFLLRPLTLLALSSSPGSRCWR